LKNLIFRRSSDMPRKPYIAQEVCLSCCLCAETVPEAIRMNDDVLAEVFNPYGASEEQIQKAIDNCLVNCIHWE
jgi:ferredoxin